VLQQYDLSMTKRITVSLPDDVAAYLATQENSSAAVAQAVRAQMNRGAATRAMLEAAGFNITEEGMARWRGKLRPPTEEQRARDRQWMDAVRSGRLPDEEA
jgi:hypothetical protein